MCQCNPNIRTPFCGKLGCRFPTQPAQAPTEQAANPDELAAFLRGIRAAQFIAQDLSMACHSGVSVHHAIKSFANKVEAAQREQP